MTNATLTSPPLTRADRCDRCGAAARVRAKLSSGAASQEFAYWVVGAK